MKITEITASVGQTIQIKQYEPRTYHASVKIEVGEKEKPEKAFKLAREKANKEVESYFKNLKEKVNQKKFTEEEPFPDKIGSLIEPKEEK